MKKLLTLVLALTLCSVMFAQPGSGKRHQQHPEPPKVEEIVNDLTPIQKKRLESVTQESKKQVEKLKAELKEVRSQVQKIMDKDGDHSDELFPLLERESYLKTEITKEMYRTRIKIDEILTKEQIQKVRASCKAARQSCKAKDTKHEKGR